MSEEKGMLKTRIRQLGTLKTREDLMASPPSYTDEALAIVEEAQQEKPTMRKIQAELIQKYPNTVFTEHQFLMAFFNRDQEWTKRWLGGDKTE